VPWEYPSVVPAGRSVSSEPQQQHQYQQPLILDNIQHELKLGQDPFDDKFEKRVNWLLDHFHVPGLSIAVVTGNETFLRVILSSPLIFQSTKALDSDVIVCLDLGIRSL
jgi:hypothetical protein